MGIKSNVFQIHEQGKLMYLTIPQFDELNMVNHCFTTRLGGVSRGIFQSMNLSKTNGDELSNVEENYRRICEAIGVNSEDLVYSDQVHDTKIHCVTKENANQKLSGIDGLITNEPNIPLVTFFADCVPLFFLDPREKVIALAHAGWRGTVGKIGKKVVDLMEDQYHSKREDIYAAIGPSIGACCFEVGEEVAEEFKKIFPKKEIISKEINGKCYIDLWRANQITLLESDISQERITITDLCTKCNKDYFFSHRGHHGKRGTMAAIMELR